MTPANRRLVWWLTLLLGLGGTYGLAQSIPRFHRYALTHLDATTTIDVVKDVATGTCWAVYRTRHRSGYSVTEQAAVTTLGAVPCQPIPVTSPIR